ncbi:hypothetical protein [Jeongeupia sp. USM3]|uniref:hypothetical protein n=1 Tax=Jeongeupia sp. USM3 TaxID=1906741 RepID=UPI00089E036B|nr:hypothetical protein [Jeongeupia sp. USM3]AOX99285.1 hypothetical protein BJP62_01750 [Jeongeupia sp. USM3]
MLQIPALQFRASRQSATPSVRYAPRPSVPADDAPHFEDWLQRRRQLRRRRLIDTHHATPSESWSDRLVFTLMHTETRQRGDEAQPACKRQQLRDAYTGQTGKPRSRLVLLA